jgi:predicted nucleotidyltransferase
MNTLVKNKMHEIAALCKAHKVNVLSVFGSAAGNKMHAHSDVDFLVRFSDDIDAIEYSDNYFSLLHELESLMGKRVDLLSEKSLKNAVLIAEIERTKVQLYAA